MINIIFDMDGTLLDTQKIYVPAWEEAGRLQGVEGMGELAPRVCGTNNETCKEIVYANYPSIDYDAFKKDVHKYVENNCVVKFKKGAKELLDFLKAKNIKFGLASGTERGPLMERLTAVGAEKDFEAIVCGSEVEKGKPHPEVFLKTAELMGVDPETCIVFEDSPLGIRAAATAGMKPVGIFDIAPFDEVRHLMYKELNHLGEAIQMIEEMINS